MATDKGCPAEVHAIMAGLVRSLRVMPDPVARPVGEQFAALQSVSAIRVRLEPQAPVRTVAEQLAALWKDRQKAAS